MRARASPPRIAVLVRCRELARGLRGNPRVRPFTFSIAFAATGCFHLGDSTTGEKGRLEFEIVSSQCGLGCALSTPILEGSMIELSVTKLPADAQVVAALVPSSLGTVSQRSCGAACLTVDVETAQSGDGELELRDPRGGLVDRAKVHVAQAARVEVELELPAAGGGDPARVAPDAQGAYALPANAKASLRGSVFDARDQRMAFTKHGLAHRYADAAVVRADLLPDGTYPVGPTDVEPMVTGRAGRATVTVEARGASKSVPILVR